jgi:hypothetical protein
MKKDSRIERAGVAGFNKPKATPSHPTKSHIVVAKEGDKVKTLRFGQQGVKTNQTVGQREAFKSRHAKNIAKGKMSPAYWADKVNGLVPRQNLHLRNGLREANVTDKFHRQSCRELQGHQLGRYYWGL